MTETVSPLRRVPSQRRSAERVQRMLDACAELIEESGYDGLSTTRVAQRAQVAIGSVYQFFPDKRAIAQALALRNLELFGDRVARLLADGDFEHWYDTVGVIIDAFVEMHRTVPGFGVLRFGDVADMNLLDGTSSNNAVVAGRLRALLIDALGVSDMPSLARAVMVAVEAGDAVLQMAFRHDPAGDPELLAEVELLIRGYLAQHIEVS